MSQFLAELPEIVNPDSEGRPPGSDTAEHERCVCGQGMAGYKRASSAGFDEAKEGEEKEADYEEDIGVWCGPTDYRALIPCEVDKY